MHDTHLLLDFLRLGAFGPCTPTAHCTPEDVFLALGAPEEAYAPGDLDRAYVAGDARCFPLIVAYGDVEFHFAAPTELTTLFVDSFSGRRGAPDGGPLKLADPGPLREGTSLAQFEAAAAALGIGIRSIRPYSPPYAFVALTEGGVEVGFEHDDRTRRVRSPCCGGSAGRIPSPKERAIAAVGNRLRPIATMPHSRNDTPMTPNDLYAFLSDKRLVDLIERVKISDDFLDVVSLTETQHSDMLAWCLHPNEGHGQGDAVIKDFLIAAYEAGQETNKFANKIFFETWTPGKIRTSSFGSAFIAREFSLTTADTRRGRLDLFLIDPGNKIIVTIENKAGASLTETQLSDYYAAVSQQISNRRVFSDYQFAYIVVDRDLADYPEEHLKSLGNKWALLDYGWLEASANRARLHLERNNEAAQLLMAYCQKQTGWQSPNEKQVNELAAELASQHEAVVEAIRLQRRSSPRSGRQRRLGTKRASCCYSSSRTASCATTWSSPEASRPCGSDCARPCRRSSTTRWNTAGPGCASPRLKWNRSWPMDTGQFS